MQAPKGSIYIYIIYIYIQTERERAIKEFGPSILWFLGPNSITVVYRDPLGKVQPVASDSDFVADDSKECKREHIRPKHVKIGNCVMILYDHSKPACKVQLHLVPEHIPKSTFCKLRL